MKKLLTRVAIPFAAVLVMVLGFATNGASAATVHGCPADNVCLYQNINYGANRWQSSYNNIAYHHAGSCLTLTTEAWPSPPANGGLVNNNTSGAVINTVSTDWNGRTIYFYDGADCTSFIDSEPLFNGVVWQIPQFGSGAYHKITSMKVQ